MPLPPSPVIYEVNTIAWLSELSRREGRPVTLGTVSGRDWDTVTGPGIHAVWLMGVWERSPAGLTVALANPALREEFRRALPDLAARDVAASPYCVRRYVVDRRFGGAPAITPGSKRTRSTSSTVRRRSSPATRLRSSGRAAT